MITALFPGTFDPPTLAHQEIIERASKLCDKLYVAVVENEGKPGSLIPVKERVALLKKLVKSWENVEVISFKGLVVDCAKEKKANVLVRGVRNARDLEYEMQMASANKGMTGIETVCLLASPQYCQISSTLVREIAAGGGCLKGFVDEGVIEGLKSR